jgi:hypothetical protein
VNGEIRVRGVDEKRRNENEMRQSFCYEASVDDESEARSFVFLHAHYTAELRS